jgi:hypothetical protein
MSLFRLKNLWIGTLICALSSGAFAQDAAKASAQKAPKAVKAEAAPTAEPAPAPAPPPVENTLDACGDGVDNDGDSHVDCDDQDCEIYAICVQEPEAPAPEQPVEVEPAPEVEPIFILESGMQCRDGVDNNQDGLIDCHEPSCQLSSYCRKVMYERPDSKDKKPGLFFNFGFGVALPNFRIPTMETTWTDSSADGEQYTVPFDPDLGVMLDFQIGYLFLKFMGAGVAMKSAFTGASNRSLYFDTDDNDSFYKYTGNKYYGNVSAFLRFQWPFKRVTPYLNLHAGYSVAQATWYVYEPENTWSEIDDAESNNNDEIYLSYGEQTQIRSDRERHFTFAVEPGVEISVVPKLFSVGLKAWLPVIANVHSSYDNTGVLLSFGFTPMWRERLQLKPEYAAEP